MKKRNFKILCVIISIFMILSIMTTNIVIATDIITEQYSELTNLNSQIPINSFNYSLATSKLNDNMKDLINVLAQNPDIYGYTVDELNNLEICDPFQILTYKDNKIIAMNSQSYMLKSNNNIKGIVNLSNFDGEYLIDYSNNMCNELNNLFNSKAMESFVLLSDGENIFALSSDNSISQITDYNSEKSAITERSLNNKSIYDLNLQYENFATYTVNLNTNELLTNNAKNSNEIIQPQSTSSVMTQTAPISIAMQSLSPVMMNQNIPTWHFCQCACIASIVKTRIPSISIDGTTVQWEHTPSNPNAYPGSNLACFMGDKRYIETAMRDYLTSASGHYSTYSTSSYDLTMFKNNCDASHLMIDVAYKQGEVGTYHCVVTFDYTNLISGGIFVKFMDPNTATFRLQEWVSGSFKYYMNPGVSTV